MGHTGSYADATDEAATSFSLPSLHRFSSTERRSSSEKSSPGGGLGGGSLSPAAATVRVNPANVQIEAP